MSVILEPGVIVLPKEAACRPWPSPGGLSCWWASRALHDASLPEEDREMALAAYARAMDVQLGTVGKGEKSGLREIFPLGEDPHREADARRRAEAASTPVPLFEMGDLS